MKKLLFIIICIASLLQVSANKTDSLLALLKNTEEQASVYNALAEENLYNNQAKALEYTLKAIDIANTKDDVLNLSIAYKLLGSLYYFSGDLVYASESFNTSLKFAKEIDFKEGISAAYNNLAIVSSEIGEIDKALYWYKESVQIDKELNDSAAMAAGYLNIGTLYQAIGDYKDAYHFYAFSLSIYQALGLERDMADCYINIGSLEQENDLIAQSTIAYKKAISICIKYKDSYNLGIVYNNVGLNFVYIEQMDSAKYYIEKSIYLRDSIGDSLGLAKSYLTYGIYFHHNQDSLQADKYLFKSINFFLDMDLKYEATIALYETAKLFQKDMNYKKAIEFYLNSVEFGEECGAIPVVFAAYQELAFCYEQIEDYKKAHFYLSLYYTYDDSYNTENADNDSVIEKDSEARKNTETDAAKSVIIKILVFLCFVLLISTIIYRRLYIKSK